MELAIIKNEIDWMKIIDMAFKRKDWGKTYNLFVSGDVSISVTMKLFNFERNEAEFRIKCVYPQDQYHNRYVNDIDMAFFLYNYDLGTFNLLVLKKVDTLLGNIIRIRTKTKASEIYSELEYMHGDLTGERISEAGFADDYKSVKGITNSDIRDDAMWRLEEKVLDVLNEEFNNEVNRYVAENENASDDMIRLRTDIQNLINKSSEVA